ncbi:hypothetical protein K8I61_14780 [bacterium]|nr:hypothetical protein [bacterium]
MFLIALAVSFFLAPLACGDVGGGDGDDDDDDDVPGDDDDFANGDDDDSGDDDTDDDDDAGDDDDADGDDDDKPDPPETRYFAADVIDYEIGVSGGFGEDYLPGNVLGAPVGFGPGQGNNDERDVFSLGHGGWIVLEMKVDIADGDGPDFVVFENPFNIGDTGLRFIETAFVEVSADGVDFVRMPNDYDPTDVSPQADPASFSGFAGVTTVSANLDPDGDGETDDWIDPADLTVSGGDAFDLADAGLASARYVRIIDTGSIARAPGTESYDDDGTLIEDQGNLAPLSGDKDGFDLDAVCVIHAVTR